MPPVLPEPQELPVQEQPEPVQERLHAVQLRELRLLRVLPRPQPHKQCR